MLLFFSVPCGVKRPVVSLLSVSAILCASTSHALAEPAPYPSRIIEFDNTVRSFTQTPPLESALAPTVTNELISEDGAEWLKLKFAEFNLGSESRIIIRSLTDQSQQEFTQASLLQAGGESAMFNGGILRITLVHAPADKNTSVFYNIAHVIVGQKPSQPVQRNVESLCTQGQDSRVPFTFPTIGRLMPVGCSAWIIDNGLHLTAGHCVTTAMQILQFEVPPSLQDGTPVNPSVDHQYKVDLTSVRKRDGGEGNDWAVFRVKRNTQTNLLPLEQQGSAFAISQFTLSDPDSPKQVRVTGFGVDATPPGPFPPLHRNQESQTLQTSSGALVSHDEDKNSQTFSRLGYLVDTEPANSGSPIIALRDDGSPLTRVNAQGIEQTVAVGIHTHGGCDPSIPEGNGGTSFSNADLMQSIAEMSSQQ